MSLRPGKKDTKIRIRASPITVDDRYAEDMWSLLKSSFQKLLTRKGVEKLNHEELYRMAYAMVLHNHGERLYSGLQKVVTEHLVEKVCLDVLLSHNDNFLDTLNTAWSNYQISMAMIRDVVMYMDRVYVHQNGVADLATLRLILFRDLVVKNDGIRDRVSQTLLSLVRREREGDFVDRMAIKNTCEMLLALGIESRSVYEDYFEKPFLDESAEFFKLESQILLGENNASVYLKKVETRMQEEAERARHFLDPSTEEDIVKIAEEELLYKHMKTVIEMENSGVNHMLKHNKIEDLLRLFRLFTRILGKNNDVLMDWLKMVRDCMRRYFPEEVKKIENCEDPTTYFEEFRQVLNLIEENKVPPEILARGPLALEAYKNALTEGETHVKRVPVMLIGQERSGKTSLQKSLKGKPFNPDEGSTVGIDIDPSHFKLSTEIWKLGEKDQITNSGTNISYEHHAARLTVANLRQNKGSPEKELPESGSIPLVNTVSTIVRSDPQSASSTSNVVSAHDSMVEPGISDFALGASAAAVPSTSSLDSATFHDIPEDAQSGGMSRDSESTQTSRYPQNADFISDMSEDMATLVEMYLKEDNKVEKEEGEEDIYSVLWDFAGQSVYYATHPVFLNPRAIYLLVNNLSQNPHEKAEPVEKQGIFRKRKDIFNVKTNLNYLDLWMSSVASLAIQNERREVNPESEVLPMKLPPVFLVCTHADKPYGGGDPRALANDVFGSLRSKPHKSHLYDDFFVVDNTKSGHQVQCSEVVRLREEVLEVAKKLPHLKEPIPIKWLRYEKALKARREYGDKWIPLDSARQIASEECNITDQIQFRTLLDFLHDQRILVHFSDSPKLDNLVVLDPQWLIDVFKKVITIKPYDRKEKEFQQLWCKLEERGILEDKLLKHAWETLFDNEENIESLIEIMERFSLLCLWPSSDASCDKQYLVPSMLMSHPPEGIMQLVASAQVPSLFLKFESGQVPLGLFPRLVLQFFQWGKDKYTSAEDPKFYHNFARFYTSTNYSVILLCHSSSIEVVVHKGRPILDLAESLQSKLSLSSNVSNDPFVVSCAHAVRRQLGLLLESMRNEFCWLKSMKYEESFLCPVCCQGGEICYCDEHDAEGCKQEECLHFWSESKLHNVKNSVCTKSAVAEDISVRLEQSAPWLAPIGNQPTLGESDGRSVASVEGSKKIAIPDQIVAALLSQSCDAKEIVLQLRETIKVEDASLEQPDSETKTLIRCVARKAKESNRLDVFKHLREITPAGCTGPLLSENLDIRNIPISKGRELTFDLSGGPEWEVVAEGLGLTPTEIRFLNSRTLNPFDAALSFIAKQRHITVGNLYDLLNKLGFPVIADRRL